MLPACRLVVALVLAAAIAALAACAPATVREAREAPAPSAELANAVLFRALSLVGTPYRRAGNSPDAGFDCSGLVGYVYADAAGVALPRSSAAQMQIAVPAIARNALAPSDLVFFATRGRVSHVGIYVGDGRFVHAPSSGGSVRLDALDGDYWAQHYAGARRALALAR